MIIAQKGKQTTVKSIVKTEVALFLKTENGNIKLEPYSDAIIRVVYTLAEHFSEVQGIGTLPKAGNCEWTYIEKESTIILSTKLIVLVVDKQTCAFSYFDQKGKLLVKEPVQGGKTLIPFDAYKSILDENTVLEKIVTPDGEKVVIRDAKKVFYKTLYHTKLEFEWSEEEALYGLGQQEEGSLNLRGTRQYVHQANMKIAMPVLLSTKGYGILQDTYSPVIFNDNAYGSYIYNEAANELDYYFIYGESFDDIIKGYRFLTGKATMLPKWAFGYIQSIERYETQQEILDTVSEYRRREVPLDCIVLDWHSWEEGLWGQKTFDLARFPKVEEMTETLHEMGAHFMISIWPNMNAKSDNYSK